MDWQLTIVWLCIAAAAFAVGRRAWRWLPPRGNSCNACGSCSAASTPDIIPLDSLIRPREPVSLPHRKDVDRR